VIGPAPSLRVADEASLARVMVCDDSAVIRSAIARILEADPNVRVVAKVANGRLAIEELRKTQVDVVVLDIEMPVLDGMSALPLLLRADPDLPRTMFRSRPRSAAAATIRSAGNCWRR